ncbi:MAG TPA: peptide chain release factor 1 [Acidimicrobiales bacterium]
MGTLDETLAGLATELDETSAALSAPDVASNPRRLRELSRRHHQLTDLVGTWRELEAARADVLVADGLVGIATADERPAAESDLARSVQAVRDLEERLEALLLPDDPNAGRSVIVEIRGAEGGEEANLFARDLYEMYQRYAALRGYKLEVLEERASERNGLDEVVFKVVGDDAWVRFEHEAGTHRVQRVPVTESKGRIHTSAATVTVLPEAEEVDVQIDPADLKVDVYRSSGPGGQSVNTTDSAVRVTHVPTGIVVSMQDEKSQLQNRAKAMVVLRSRLLQRAQEEQAAKQGDLRRAVGTGGRGEKIRTYHFKENRVTDHRISKTLYNLDGVLAGQLDEFVDALIADKRARQLAEPRGG